jgi:hypothetical protein
VLRLLEQRDEFQEHDHPTGRRRDGAQFGLAAQEAAALSGAVTRFNPPAS